MVGADLNLAHEIYTVKQKGAFLKKLPRIRGHSFMQLNSAWA